MLRACHAKPGTDVERAAMPGTETGCGGMRCGGYAGTGIGYAVTGGGPAGTLLRPDSVEGEGTREGGKGGARREGWIGAGLGGRGQGVERRHVGRGGRKKEGRLSRGRGHHTRRQCRSSEEPKSGLFGGRLKPEKVGIQGE
eukprot:1375704-Rhodomonas_salina.1